MELYRLSSRSDIPEILVFGVLQMENYEQGKG